MANGILSGSGTALDPYLIEDAQDLVKAYDYRSDSKYFRQTKDIDCTGVTMPNTYVLGSGYYYGYGYVIRNMNLKIITTSTSGANSGNGGFVSAIWGSVTVTNLGLENCSVTYITAGNMSENSGIGMMFGNTLDSLKVATIKNCYTKNCSVYVSLASTTGTAYQHAVGGFAGRINSMSVIENCYAHGTVGYMNYAGGFVGSVVGNASIKNCVSLATTMTKLTQSSTPNNAGSFYGYVSSSPSIVNSYDVGDTQFIQGGVG